MSGRVSRRLRKYAHSVGSDDKRLYRRLKRRYNRIPRAERAGVQQL